MKFDFKSLFSSVEDFSAKVRQVKQELERLKIERDEVASAPMAREDVEAWISFTVDEKGAQYPDMLFNELRPLMYKCQDIAPGEGNEQSHIFKLDLLAPNRRKDGAVFDKTGKESIAGFQASECFFYPETVKENIIATLDRCDFSNAGLPKKERAIKLAQLDKDIANLQEQLKEVQAKNNELRQSLAQQ